MFRAIYVLVLLSLGSVASDEGRCLSDVDGDDRLLVEDASTGWRRLSSGQPYPFNTGCDFDVVYLDGSEAEDLINNNKLPERYADWLAKEPLLVRRKNGGAGGDTDGTDGNDDTSDTDDNLGQSFHPNELFQNLTTKAYMTEVYGDYLVGVDFPGRDAPPTERWEQIPLKEYIARFVDGDWDMERRAASHTSERYLFGPSDTCHTHMYMKGSAPTDDRQDVCRHGATEYQQLWMNPDLGKQNRCIIDGAKCNQNLYGLGGPYSGIYFHAHPGVFNEVVHGQKLWLTYSWDKYSKLISNGAFGKFDDVRNGDVSAAWFISKVLPTLNARRRPKRCLAEQGDVVYIPKDTVHLTMNLGDTLFAVTGRVLYEDWES
ncbi:hypothetical protein TrRE_jg9010 [Triparma retinervis]|uniref:JmjC domain-containing protein n=1 Tax=Triparma retinervis TaxID=2557542 RepID=A0A9W6ZAX0_9STRA|nr:hypothetical protein TrRE_jg9010 [Triparma retinervis]